MNSSSCDMAAHSSSVLAIAALSIFSGLVAVGGNSVVLLAIHRTHTLRTTSNLFIASLAASDWIVGSVMQPLLVYKSITYSYFGRDLFEHDPFKIGTDFLWIQAIIVTTFGLTAVSLDRFIAITMVFRYESLLTSRRCTVAIFLNWTFSFIFASLRLFLPENKLPLLWVSTAVLSCGLPFTITFYCYAAIFKAARSQMRRIVNEATAKEGRRIEEARHRKTAWTIGIVITFFFFLWFPSLVIASINLTLPEGCTKLTFARQVWLWVELIAYTSSSINPWVYSMRSVEFRAACKQSLGLKRSTIGPLEGGGSRSKARPSNAGVGVISRRTSNYCSSAVDLKSMGSNLQLCGKDSLQSNSKPVLSGQYQTHLMPPVV